MRFPLSVLAALVGVAVGLLTLYHISSRGLKPKEVTYHVGSAQLLVDSNPSSLTQLSTDTSALALAGRAPLFAAYATDTSVVDQIAHLAGVPLTALSVSAATDNAGLPRYTNIPGGSSSGGGSAITNGTGSDLVVLAANSTTPVVSITTEARSNARAFALARATVTALQRALTHIQIAQQKALFRVQTGEQTALYRQAQRDLSALQAAGVVTGTTASSIPSGTASSASSGGTASSASSGGTASSPSAAATTSSSATAPGTSPSTAISRASKKAAALGAPSSTTLRKITPIVLRQLGAVSASTVRTTPSKSKAIGYGVGAFLVLLLIILMIDGALQRRRARRSAGRGSTRDAASEPSLTAAEPHLHHGNGAQTEAPDDSSAEVVHSES